MEEFDIYEFSVEVWAEDGEWNYSVIQEFDDEVEVLHYGSAETALDAMRAVSDFLPTLDFD